jgi:malonate transporter
MLHILEIILPVFGLIAAGFLTRLIGYVGDKVGEGLSEFVYTVAIPCLIFRTLTGVHMPDVQPWGYWYAYFGGVAIVWTLGSLIAGRIFGATGVSQVVAGFCASQSNTVLVGIPLILEAYGEAGAVPLFLLIAIHLPIMLAVGTVLAEGRDTHWTRIARQLATHPILMSIVASVAFRQSGFAVPGVLTSVVNQIGTAAIPCALFAMGMALRRYGIREGAGLAAAITVLKLVVHPAIVMLLAYRVFSMPPAWAGVAVLFAASSVGVNAYLFAERYREGVGLASSAIALSTGCSVVTTSLWLLILGVGRL